MSSYTAYTHIKAIDIILKIKSRLQSKIKQYTYNSELINVTNALATVFVADIFSTITDLSLRNVQVKLVGSGSVDIKT